MPRKRLSGAIDSISVTSAPQPDAKITPVSSNSDAPPLGRHAAAQIAPRQQIQQQRHRHRAAERRRVDHPGRCHEQHRRQRADRRTAGYAQHIWIGQRIAQQRLHHHARQRQRAAGDERRLRASEPQFQQRGRQRRRRAAQQFAQRRRQIGQRQHDRTDNAGQQQRSRGQQRQRDQDSDAAMTAHEQCNRRITSHAGPLSHNKNVE
jgi:hypothetical protein